MIQKNAQVILYKRQQVSVVIPPELSRLQVRRVKLLPPDIIKKTPLPEGFFLIRPVINIDFYDPHSPKTPLDTFNPPVTIHVRYTQADQAAAAAKNGRLNLAYWDNDQWVIFTPEKHKFRLIPDSDSRGGEGVVEISRWGDPMIVWGG